ncbi:MAG: alanine--tRNA ligase [Myxococcota bacterium]
MPKSSHEIRSAFLEFFRERQHEVVPSGPLVPANDPTLMFANAGMVQFKDVFTGHEKRPYSRATSAQKCIRISGKHNDLENVGVTARHHTFFEMLGNFSFGDYFKKEAIQFGWELVTKVLELPPERMVVTVFGGEGDVPADDEAARLWKDTTGFEDERIIRCGLKDNFWQMGDTGPCGPCAEIHYYLGDGAPDPRTFGEEPTPDGKGWFELWNLVFMQFDRQADGELRPLPAPSIDTGAGLERLAVVSQGVLSNYDTDLLRPLVDLASEISGKAYGGSQGPDDVSMRVIADHARTAAFLIAEGVFPDREGRAYVLRRVMRRAIRHGHRLGIDEPFLHDCALKVVQMMGESYPELVERRDLIADVTRQEEERFRQTLKRGLDLLEHNDDWKTDEHGNRVLPGPVAFKLYDTFGFPLDLQEVIGRERDFGIDEAGFAAELEAARDRSAGSKVGQEAVAAVHRELRQQLGPVEFTGYENEKDHGEILALVRGGERVERLAEGEEGEIITDRTPFYGEAGGQVGDRGEIRALNAVFVVEDTRKPVDGFWVHQGRMSRGALEEGAGVELEVDHAARGATRRNHSATHLLHWALRKVVGPTAMQKGSLVGPDRLRFDYSGSKPLTAEQIAEIEDLVNDAVLDNTPVVTEVLAMDEAKSRGAVGIFEEKYGDVVRMLRIGPSLELCGGTHAFRTGDIGAFKIVSDGGLAAGVRRIEGATGLNTLRYLREVENELGETAALVKSPPLQTHEKVEGLLEQQREREREIARLKRQLMSGGSRDLSAEAREVNGLRVLGATVELGDAKALREMADQLRDKLGPAVIMLGSTTQDGKALLVCSVSKDVTDRVRAGDLVREAAQVVGGGGGGRPDFAQAGGPDGAKLDDAVARVYDLVS